MPDHYQRAVNNRQAGTPQARGLADPPRLAKRCYQLGMTIPGTYDAFEAQIEKWIAT